jgi:hypothetical protein
MSTELITDAELRQLLLGNVDDKERQRIESLYITNDLLRERVLAVEQDLIEDYLEDSLTAADKEKFLRQYADTPERRQKLRITKSIKDWALLEGTKVAGAAPASGWSRLRARLRLKPLFVIPIAATAIIAIMIGTVWLNSKMQERNKRLALEEEVARLNTPSSLREVPAQMSTLILRPVSVRSVEAQSELMKNPNVEIVELQSIWPQKERYPAYQAVVRQVGDDQSFTITNLQAENDGNIVRLRLPAHRLSRGHYQIELTGIAADGSKSPPEEYNFTLGN